MSWIGFRAPADARLRPSLRVVADCVEEGWRVPVSNTKTTAISLVLPSLQAMALAQFVKRVDFETVTRFAAVTVVCEDGKSEADLIWLALIALRSALAEASPGPADCPRGQQTKLGPRANQRRPALHLVGKS
jgi:hypothetical protein